MEITATDTTIAALAGFSYFICYDLHRNAYMPTSETIQLLCLLLFGIATAVQVFFWALVFRPLARFRQPDAARNPSEEEFVSVIICARNEEEHLKKNLSHFLNQSYRSFEVIVVNDGSTDRTRNVVLDSMQKWRNLRLVETQHDTPPGKKAALTLGIRAARGNYLLLSDADCRPASTEWISSMTAHTNTILEIGLGFGPYDRKRGLLNRFIRYETAYTAVQYFSLALQGLPYMGVGRNLLYKRSLFVQAGGFESHAHIASGDDDLFVNAVATKQNTAVVLDEKTFVFSEPKSTLRGYFKQKQRHVSTGRSYRLLHQVLLGALSASHLLHYATAAACWGMGAAPVWVLCGVLLRWAVVFLRWEAMLRRLQQRDLLGWVIPLDLLYLLYYLTLTPALLVGNRNRWN